YICSAASPRKPSDSDQASIERAPDRHEHAGVAVLWRREDLATVSRPPERDDGQPRARVGDGTDSTPTTTARVLQRRGDEQIRQVLPASRSECQADRGLRPEDGAVHDDRLLFCCGP